MSRAAPEALVSSNKVSSRIEKKAHGKQNAESGLPESEWLRAAMGFLESRYPSRYLNPGRQRRHACPTPNTISDFAINRLIRCAQGQISICQRWLRYQDKTCLQHTSQQQYTEQQRASSNRRYQAHKEPPIRFALNQKYIDSVKKGGSSLMTSYRRLSRFFGQGFAWFNLLEKMFD